MHPLWQVCILHPYLPLHLTKYPSIARRPAQRGVQEWKARISIRSRPPPSSDGPPDAPTEPPTNAEANALLPSLTPYLCYACHTTLTGRSARPVPSPWAAVAPSSVAPLPVWAEARLSSAAGGGEEIAHPHEEIMQKRRVGQDEMKGIVQEFLLDD